MPTDLPARRRPTPAPADTDPILLAGACAVLAIVSTMALQRALLTVDPARLDAALAGAFAIESVSTADRVLFAVATAPTP